METSLGPIRTMSPCSWCSLSNSCDNLNELLERGKKRFQRHLTCARRPCSVAMAILPAVNLDSAVPGNPLRRPRLIRYNAYALTHQFEVTG